jgi:glycosyltransferase involved in cell wall biosynthesis
VIEHQLRVGYVLKRFPRLSQTFVLNEIAELRRQGVEVTVVARHSPGDGERRPDDVPGVPVHYLDARGTDVVASLHDAGVEHLHAHFASWAATTALHLAAELGVTYSFTAHARDVDQQTVDRAGLAATTQSAAFVVTVSEKDRRFLNEVLAAEGRSGRVLRLYNGVELAGLQPSREQPVPGRIVSVGRLASTNGLSHLVEACHEVKAAGSAFECIIAGEGDEREALERQVATAGLERDVLLPGARSHQETLDLLRSATMCVLPWVTAPDGDREALPTVLLEALALGVPVVSTTVSGVSEIVQHGDSGLLVPPADTAALTAAIETMLSSPALRERFALAATMRAHADFNLVTNVTSLKGLFWSAARSGRADP